MPGPPPGTSSSACYVTTANGIAFGEPFAQIYRLNGFGSVCELMIAVLTFLITGSRSGAVATGGPNTTWTAAGWPGGDVDQCYYTAYNAYFYSTHWEASWLG